MCIYIKYLGVESSKLGVEFQTKIQEIRNISQVVITDQNLSIRDAFSIYKL